MTVVKRFNLVSLMYIVRGRARPIIWLADARSTLHKEGYYVSALRRALANRTTEEMRTSVAKKTGLTLKSVNVNLHDRLRLLLYLTTL